MRLIVSNPIIGTDTRRPVGDHLRVRCRFAELDVEGVQGPAECPATGPAESR
jgi:hypothetical protein